MGGCKTPCFITDDGCAETGATSFRRFGHHGERRRRRPQRRSSWMRTLPGEVGSSLRLDMAKCRSCPTCRENPFARVTQRATNFFRATPSRGSRRQPAGCGHGRPRSPRSAWPARPPARHRQSRSATASQPLSKVNVFAWPAGFRMRTIRPGGFRVDKVWEDTPEVVWRKVKHLARVDEATFESYYKGRSKAFALNIAHAWEHKHPLPLADLRRKFANFVVPQSWRYLTAEERRSFGKMKRIAVGEPSISERSIQRVA